MTILISLGYVMAPAFVLSTCKRMIFVGFIRVHLISLVFWIIGSKEEYSWIAYFLGLIGPVEEYSWVFLYSIFLDVVKKSNARLPKIWIDMVHGMGMGS